MCRGWRRTRWGRALGPAEQAAAERAAVGPEDGKALQLADAGEAQARSCAAQAAQSRGVARLL